MKSIKTKCDFIHLLIFMITLIMTISLAGCNDVINTGSNESSSGDAQSSTISSKVSSTTSSLLKTPFSSTVDGIEFGISPDELVKKLKENKMDLKTPDYSIAPDGIKIVKDGRQYNTAFQGFFYATKNGMTIEYDSRNGKDIFIDFVITSPDIATAEGLKVGDSFDKMKSIYGENYTKVLTNCYQYYNGKVYLYITCDNDKIWLWTISKSSTVDYNYDS